MECVQQFYEMMMMIVHHLIVIYTIEKVGCVAWLSFWHAHLINHISRLILLFKLSKYCYILVVSLSSEELCRYKHTQQWWCHEIPIEFQRKTVTVVVVPMTKCHRLTLLSSSSLFHCKNIFFLFQFRPVYTFFRCLATIFSVYSVLRSDGSSYSPSGFFESYKSTKGPVRIEFVCVCRTGTRRIR
jgi:hypothetical protein